ncbi:MAG TPA: non-ribosomal peptide synthetase, partial [Ktedonobacteraceae bacterium]|nr:non-ribosomal peptide synthetase [Ktedonobacteraceae bacterium]
FEAQVARTPDAISLMYQSASLTYRELNRRANQLAHYLQRFGVGPETLVGLCVERSPEMIVGVLGILKAGGAYVPLDPVYPEERLNFMLSDAQSPVLLTQERVSAKLAKAEHALEVIYLDTDWDKICLENEENPASGVLPENAAYVIYTSGSTGTPKGVVIQHQSLVNYTEAAIAAYSLHPGDRVLQFATLSFDASAEEIYPCLSGGATLVLRTTAMLDSMTFFLEKCEEWAITVLDLPTAFWHELTRKISEKVISLPPSVRLVIIGGEKALLDMMTQWQKHVNPQVQIVNTYGPTEATIVATMYRVPASATANNSLQEIPIGRPIPNTQVYLLDQNLHVVPIGVSGELYIGGIGLAREYLNRPALTRERFIPHPFSTGMGTRLYKTGDLASYLPTGDIIFLGRADQQVKIRGYRIELGEIETALEKHPDILDAVVQAREDGNGGKRLVAYVVPRHGHTFTSSNLRHFLQDQLPDYMVPAAFVLLEALPLSPSGKVDRFSLPLPEQGRSELPETFVAPTLPVHHQLVQIWEELLEVRPIGIQDDFFDLGGHSLLAVRLVDRIEQVWGKKISPATLIAGPTVEQLAQALGQPEVPASKTSLEAIQGNKPSQSPFSRSGKFAFSVKAAWGNLTGRRQE